MPDPTPLVATPCPICRKPATPRFHPFCCARCADVDLGRWFTESYRAAAAEPDGADDGTA